MTAKSSLSRPRVLALTLWLCALATAGVSRPQNVQPKQAPPIRVHTEEVVVDVIVTDRNGRPMTALAAADFEVYEDKIRQEIKSFRLESRGKETLTDSSKPGPAPG